MDKKWNLIILSISFLALVGFFILIRQQATVTDRQFLKSMIPHHGAAILMAKHAAIKDPEIKVLTEKIIKDQQAEIAQMKAKLKELNKE